jgi:hypothetical protein
MRDGLADSWPQYLVLSLRYHTIAMSTESSWHPAFMPNSAADLIPKGATQPSNTAPLQDITPQAVNLTPTPPPSNPASEKIISDTKQSAVTQEKTLEDNGDGNSELANLRDALTTSLASPGGVELEENPLDNVSSSTDIAQAEKADFPSEGPIPHNKHSSTMSFARTVSQEVNWGEEDDVDPEWNIQRSDTDPFKLMPKSDRTNSFPQVPPAHSPATAFEPLHSEVEEIMNGVEREPKDLFDDNDHGGEDDFFSQGISANNGADDFVDKVDGDAQGSSYGQAFGGEFRQEEDQESQARFEEGLPLVQPAEVSRGPAKAPSMFVDGDGEEEDFFSQVKQPDAFGEEQTPSPHPLERKSTMQVMGSMHFQPHEQSHDPIPEEDISSSHSSLDKATDRGIAVASSTILSQVLAGPVASIHDQPEGVAALGFASGDGDLAEKWKAALAGDEFLDDDDFLADDDPTESKALDPSAVFGSDNEGFLDDNDLFPGSADFISQQISPSLATAVTDSSGQVAGFDSLTGSAQTHRPTSSGNQPGGSSSRYLPAGAQTAVPLVTNPYAPSAPVFTDLSRPATSGIQPSPYSAPIHPSIPAQLPQPQRPEAQKAQSFADKSKGGYSSPYDLPMDVVKPRKRVSMQTMSHAYNQPPAPVAPPRSSSMHAQQAPPSRGSTSSLSPPASSHSFKQSQLQVPADQAVSQASPPTLKTKASFFEELPMSSLPKVAPRNSSLPTSQSNYSPTPPPGYAHPPLRAPSQPVQGLVAPERVSPYATLPSNAMLPPVPASRYSPAPTQVQGQTGPPPLVAQSRYSPAPPPQIRQTVPPNTAPSATAAPPMLPHQPRTSSPLAHFSHDSRSNPQPQPISFDRRTSSSYDSSLKPHHLPPTREVDENEQGGGFSEPADPQIQSNQPTAPYYGMRQSQTPPPLQGIASKMGSSPKRASSSYLPQQGTGRLSSSPTFSPPKRSQTQSPGAAYTGPRLESNVVDPYQRPASVEIQTSPRASDSHGSIPVMQNNRPRGFSQGFNYISPSDGRELDPMQRWRGAPVFLWGVGGTLVTSFPKDVPRYGMNQATPLIIRSPGEVKIRNIKEVAPLAERLTSFPGPLKGKSKKKEVVAWLMSGITILEQNASYLRSLSTLSHEDKRMEERILLWKVLQVFIEHDGTLEGNPVVDKAVRSVLSPRLDEQDSVNVPLYATGSELSGISHSSTSMTRADPVDPAAVDKLRTHLLSGDREKAIWEAVDKRLWAHALLISNTVSKELYKQVAQEFVQKEVKNIGDNTESLAALYDIFAGNFEESIDELVPPSARAGFQMVSASNGTGPSKDALDGLDRWRETLGLVLSNRSTDDNQALNALGKLLSGYGRAEAAHICFLFARTQSVFGSIDDPQASIVLVGSDHLRQPFDFDKELEPILLSEVFEYGMSLSSTSNVAISSPHLAIYKIQHALTLAEYGYREKALQYCDAIATSITSQTRRSPYHHSSLVSELDDLSQRLKQSRKDGKSSWISKPSIDKVSGSVWSTFTNFVAGDESDTGTPGSNTGSGAEVGPFARIAGGTPTISRSPSTTDLYGTYNGGPAINGTLPQPSMAGSRYAPGGSHTPPAELQRSASFQPGSYGSQTRSSFEGRLSGEHRRGPYEPVRRDSDYRPDSQPTANSYVPQSSSFSPQSSSYSPYGKDPPYTESGPSYTVQAQVHNNEQSVPTSFLAPQVPDSELPSSYSPPEPSYDPQHSSAYESPASFGYEPPSNSSYEPPSSGYEPPSYEPATMNDEPDSPIETRPKKKSFMDDDDDDIPSLKRAPESREKTKEEKDREAQEAFRKAAEADG